MINIRPDIVTTATNSSPGSRWVPIMWIHTTTMTWVVSGWVLLTPGELNTFGKVETYPGTDVYISAPDATGPCTM